jgi:5-deoxy-glucuronate isomerase
MPSDSSNDVKRLYRPRLDHTYRHDVRADGAGWKYLSFAVVRLEPGQTIHENLTGEECAIVPLVGQFTVTYADEAYTIGRQDVFRELTDIVYLPPRTEYRVTAVHPCEFAIGRAPATGKLPPRRIRCGEVRGSVRGGANVARGVNVLLDSDALSERLIAFEIRPPSGNWSSFPPHRHDTRDNSSYHEETYYYRLTPADGFALQRIYTRDTDLDVAIPVHDGDLVLVHEGYHAVVNAPGTNAYYLNFLAGDVRKMKPINDTHYDWVKNCWDGNPIAIPVAPEASPLK